MPFEPFPLPCAGVAVTNMETTFAERPDRPAALVAPFVGAAIRVVELSANIATTAATAMIFFIFLPSTVERVCFPSIS